MTFCQTLRHISHETWSFLGKARSVSHQPLEETVTDNNIVEIKLLHPAEVVTTTFTKRKEAKTGADWEWWFTNASKTAWFGVRIQAKILKFQSGRFESLYYKSQTDVLIADAAKHFCYPLYCFYSHWPLGGPISPKQCGNFPSTPKNYGCSLADAYAIKHLKTAKRPDSLAEVMAIAYPWSCLVCCSAGTPINFPDPDLPSRARSFIGKVLTQNSSAQNQDLPEILDTPPNHVVSAMQGEDAFISLDDANLAGVMIIVGNAD